MTACAVFEGAAMKYAREWATGAAQAVPIPCAHWDIAVREQGADTRRATEERVDLALAAARIGTFDFDFVCNCVNSSRLHDELWGLKPGQSSSGLDALLERVYPDDRPGLGFELSRCIDDRSPLESEFRVVWPDGSVHWLSMRGKFTFDTAGYPFHLRGVVMETGERGRRAESLLQAAQKARDSDRVQSDFLAKVSHEIRSPLTAIIGMTSLALRAAPGPQVERYLTKISSAGESLLRIANNILDFSKIESGKMELEQIPFLLDDVLKGLYDIVGQRAEQKGVALVFSVADGTPRRLSGDPLRLGQILVNLLGNAVKFTAQGEVALRVKASGVAGGKARFTFAVSDTGIGMTAGQISNLFQSFKQADASFTRRYGGTGLGLAISKQLCDLMGGTLTAESELNKGSTFFLKVAFNIAADE